MLVHICCSVDSHFFLEKLQFDYPNEKFIGFFYDPNIHPYSEYQLRLLDVERSCKKLGIELLEGEYDFESWMEAVRGLEREPEKGRRCEACFDKRFERSVQKAKEIGESQITTTLLVSPLKSQEQLKKSGEIFFKKYGIEFVFYDYRKDGGTEAQSRVAKEEQLYRQDYCGCVYGLTMQREQQDRLMDEMFSHISNQIQPASIEERLELYRYRNELEDKDISYKIIREKFLNYRQFSFKIYANADEIIDSYALFYSILNRKKTQGNIEFSDKNIYYFSREEIKFITLEFFNLIGNFNYKNIKELIFNPPRVDQEIIFRTNLSSSNYDLSPIIIVNEIPKTKLFIELDAKFYEDSREKLIIL